MASFQKLVFLFALVSFMIYSIQAAPLRIRRVRPRDDPPPAVTPVPLNLKPQQDSFNFDLDSSLALPNSTLTPLQTVPEECAQHSECPTYFEAVNVTYDDCGDPWTICRCSTANMTMDTTVERLGKVPVGLRRFVATLLVLPGETVRAYTLTTGRTIVFGSLKDATVLVHEAAHAYDWASGSPLSGTPEWQKAIESDSCVPDVYAATSAGENFAQVAVMVIYSLIHGNTLPNGWSADCMSHQMEYMSNLPVFKKEELFGSTCAISGSVGSRHTQPPLVIPMRLPPNLPAQNLPTLPENGTLNVPTPNNTEKSPHNDNAASYVTSNVKLAVLLSSGVLVGSLFW